MASLRAAILLLDAEIEQLTPRAKSESSPEFVLVRAKSFARSLLRRAERLGIEDPRAFDLMYSNMRKQLMLTEPES